MKLRVFDVFGEQVSSSDLAAGLSRVRVPAAGSLELVRAAR